MSKCHNNNFRNLRLGLLNFKHVSFPTESLEIGSNVILVRQNYYIVGSNLNFTSFENGHWYAVHV